MTVTFHSVALLLDLNVTILSIGEAFDATIIVSEGENGIQSLFLRTRLDIRARNRY
jgi:hypothetical protein